MIFQALVEAGTTGGYVLAVIVGVNSVIALFYYARIARQMFMEDPPDGDVTPIRVPVSLTAAMAITGVITVALGVFPDLVTRVDRARHPSRPRRLATRSRIGADTDKWCELGANSRAPRTRSPLAIRRHGPLPFDEVVELALYDPELGFYSQGGAAGRRRGDFITSPEVGPLFGAVLARAYDQWWHELGEPDPFVVVDCGAGTGTLANGIRLADAECRGGADLRARRTVAGLARPPRRSPRALGTAARPRAAAWIRRP